MPDLNALLAKWQRILRLQDWVIQIRWARQYEMPADTQGRTTWALQKKSALIKILEPTDYDPSIMLPQDVEHTIVHELLHLQMALFDNAKDGSLEETALEQAVECITGALIDRDRRQG